LNRKRVSGYERVEEKISSIKRDSISFSVKAAIKTKKRKGGLERKEGITGLQKYRLSLGYQSGFDGQSI